MRAAAVDFGFFDGAEHFAQNAALGFHNKVELLAAVVIDQNRPIRVVIA